jgi:signal transduction histidine kinase
MTGTVTTRLVWLSIAIGIGLAACAGVVIIRSRRARLRDTARLRERIASDLHDEIGSNLGSIALLSEIGGNDEDLAEINRVARETAVSMQDIAWVINPLSPLSDPFKGALKRPTQKANS